MKVMVDIDEKQFGKNVERKTIKNVAQDIIDRYCGVEYYDEDDLRLIARNEF